MTHSLQRFLKIGPECVASCWGNSKYVSTCSQDTECLCGDANFQTVSCCKITPVTVANYLGRPSMPLLSMPDYAIRISSPSNSGDVLQL